MIKVRTNCTESPPLYSSPVGVYSGALVVPVEKEDFSFNSLPSTELLEHNRRENVEMVHLYSDNWSRCTALLSVRTRVVTGYHGEGQFGNLTDHCIYLWGS